MSALRKNITITEEEYQIIRDFSKKLGISFSELMRKGTLKYVESLEKRDLTAFLREICPKASKEEQKEFKEFIKSCDDTDEGEELTI